MSWCHVSRRVFVSYIIVSFILFIVIVTVTVVIITVVSRHCEFLFQFL